MPRPARPTWPEEEWRRFLDHKPVQDKETGEYVDTDAIREWRSGLWRELDKLVDQFIAERTQQEQIGSPDLRRVAPVALWLAIADSAQRRVVQAAANCREHDIPWTALSNVAGYQAANGFRRKYGAEVDAAMIERAESRSQGWIPYGDPA